MNYELLENNKVTLCGVVASLPEYSHEVYGEQFFNLYLAVERLSDNQDIIPITVSDRIIRENNFEIGTKRSTRNSARHLPGNKIVCPKTQHRGHRAQRRTVVRRKTCQRNARFYQSA